MVVLIALLLLAQAPDPNAEGLKALEARNYEAAVTHFTQAVKAAPDDYGARFHLALAYSFAGKDEEAAAEYRKVLELKPGLYEANLNLGTVLLNQKKPQEALAHLQAAIDARPGQARPNLLAGDAHYALNRFEQAGQAYYAALTADPRSAAAELGFGRTLARRGRLAEAEPHFRQAVALDPGLRESLLELAQAYEKAGNQDAALAIYEQFPDHPAAREGMGYLLLTAGRAKEAVQHLERAVEQSPTAANRVALARAYRKNNEADRAVAMVAAAVQAEPGNIDLRMAYGRELRDSLKYAEAAAQFARVVEARPDAVDAWSDLAAMDHAVGDFQKALAALDRVRELGGETPGHVFLRAMILDDLERYVKRKDLAALAKATIAEYERFLALSNGRDFDKEVIAKERIRAAKKRLERR